MGLEGWIRFPIEGTLPDEIFSNLIGKVKVAALKVSK